MLAGCSDDAGDSNGLLDALGRVRATAETRKAVEYGEPATVAKLAAEDKTRYQALQGYGYGSIAMYGLAVEKTLGIDLDTFTSGIVAGEPPKQGTVIWGDYDWSAVDKKLQALGADNKSEFGGTRWRSAGDYELSLTDGLFSDVMPTAQFNQIVTAEGSFAFAPAKEVVEWMTVPGDDTLADDDVLAGLARCLGDVIAARLEATGEAAGVRRDGSEVICLNGDQAAVTKALKGKALSANMPWDDVLPDAAVDQDGALARVTVPKQDGKPAGRVLSVMRNGDLKGLR